jgi:hypothetical protein
VHGLLLRVWMFTVGGLGRKCGDGMILLSVACGFVIRECAGGIGDQTVKMKTLAFSASVLLRARTVMKCVLVGSSLLRQSDCPLSL